MKRLGVLDGLRGIAVLLVLWYHVWETTFLSAPWPWLEFVPETGFVGVHLFFFLSGFVIVYPFVRSAWGNGIQPTWGSFASRRFWKIVPSYVLSIVVAYAIGYAPQVSMTGNDWVKDVGTHLLFIHTWWPGTYGGINGVLWTLAVEVEFYVLFPLIWWCFKRAPWLTFAGMFATALLWRQGLAHCCYNTLFGQWEENLPGYLDIFGFGMLSAYLWTRYVSKAEGARSRAIGTAVAIAGFALLAWLLGSMYDYRHADQWSSVWQIDYRGAIGLAFAVIALGSLAGATWWKASLSNPVLTFLATISYNLYLYHQIVLREMIWHHVPPSAANDERYDPAWQIRFTYLAFALTIACSALVTYAFERPIMKKAGH